MERYPVWVSDIKNLDHALTMIEQVATLVGKEKLGLNLKNKIEQQFTQLNSAFTTHHSKLKAAYLIWNDPLMAAGGDTFIHDMLTRCGLKNVFSERKRYPVISANDLAASSPDILLLSSEPYPFKEKHLREIAFVCPESKNLLVDGELFSWYGSRLLNAPDYFRSLVKQIHSRN